jgi:hypothetical protein
VNAPSLYTATVSRIRPRPVPEHTYEVDDDDGHCLYRGHDLGLADEICGSAPGLHLLVVAVAVAEAGAA